MLSLLPTPFWDTNTQTAMPGIEPKGNIGEKPLTCHRQNEAETSEKYNKYKGDVNERNRGRDLRPFFSILDTTILTDFRLHAHSL